MFPLWCSFGEAPNPKGRVAVVVLEQLSQKESQLLSASLSVGCEAVASCLTRRLTCQLTEAHTCASAHSRRPLQGFVTLKAVTLKTFGWLTIVPFFFFLGLDAELYYVRNDLISHYALSFNLLVPSETNFLHFTWHAKSKVRAAGRQHDRVSQSSEARAVPEEGPSSPQKGQWCTEHWLFSGLCL